MSGTKGSTSHGGGFLLKSPPAWLPCLLFKLSPGNGFKAINSAEAKGFYFMRMVFAQFSTAVISFYLMDIELTLYFTTASQLLNLLRVIGVYALSQMATSPQNVKLGPQIMAISKFGIIHLNEIKIHNLYLYY